MARNERRKQAGRIAVAAGLLLGAAALAGCKGQTLAETLRASGVGGAPDEFLVLPTKPLEMPTDLSALPPPTPGRPNLVDPQPEQEAVAALTGRTAPAGTASAAALLAAAGPVSPNIRAVTAAEDKVWRKENAGLLLERWAAKEDDWVIYEDMRLDAGAEFDRLRAKGLRVPAAPPVPEE